MILFGHRFIKSETFYHITNIEDITHTPPNAILALEFNEDNLDIITHANENGIHLALWTKDIQALILASASNAKYLMVTKDLAKTAQNIAENYLFDAKILVSVQEESEIEEMALLGVDGIIFANAIIKITS